MFFTFAYQVEKCLTAFVQQDENELQWVNEQATNKQWELKWVNEQATMCVFAPGVNI